MTTTTISAQDQEDERELRQLEARIAEAVVRRNSEFVGRVWAEEFFYTGVRSEIKRILEQLGVEEKSR